MCGRFALTESPETVKAVFDYTDQPNFPPRYNIAPTQPVAIVLRTETGERRFLLMRWGFLPGWVKDPKEFPLIFNIRSESASEKPAFRNALKRRRGIMPADGFYEWRRVGKESLPYLIRRKDRRPFGFAALWETFSAPDGSEIDTAAILTTAAPPGLAEIHPRAPVVIDEEAFAVWLDPATPPNEMLTCLTPPQPDLFEAVRIGPAINKVANDNPSVQEPPAEGEIAAPAPVKPSSRPRAKAPRESEDDDQGSLF